MHVEVRADRCGRNGRLHGIESAEAENVDVGAALDHPGQGGRGRAQARQGVGRAGCIAVVIGAIIESVVRGDDLEVVFLVICGRVLPLAPLNQFSGVTDAHDRRPSCRARAMAGVVAFGWAVPAIVGKPERMTHLVAGGFGSRFWVAVCRVVFEYETGRIAVPCKRGQIRHAAGRRPEPIAVAASDGNPHAPAGVSATGVAQIVDRGFLSRYVDVERCKILDDTGPDLLNIPQFRIRESCHAVDAVCRCDNRRFVDVTVPSRSGRRVPVEIEVNHLRCKWPTVQQERLREVSRTRRLVVRCHASCGSGWWV